VQVQLARATLDRALAEIPERSLDQQLALAETRAKRLTLYAPIDGRVLNVRVQPGEEVGSGPVLVLGDTSRMRVVAEVYETDIGEVSVGQSATVSSRALLKPISGRVARVGSMVFKNDVLNVDPAGTCGCARGRSVDRSRSAAARRAPEQSHRRRAYYHIAAR
jgi:HlyD family secretion protein